jgi:hypothetical protein
MNLILQYSLFTSSVLFSIGCVTVKTDKLPESWPRLVRISTYSQFAGVYRATPAATTGLSAARADRENTLPFFLVGLKNSKAGSCRIEEVRGILKLTTENDSLEITTMRLKSRSDKRALFLRNESKRIIDALSYGVGHNKLYIFATEDGSLIGLRESYGAGFVVGIFPAIGTTNQWILWEKQDKS